MNYGILDAIRTADDHDVFIDRLLVAHTRKRDPKPDIKKRDKDVLFLNKMDQLVGVMAELFAHDGNHLVIAFGIPFGTDPVAEVKTRVAALLWESYSIKS